MTTKSVNTKQTFENTVFWKVQSFLNFFVNNQPTPEIIMLSVGTSGPSHPIFIHQVKQSDHDVDEFIINKEKKKNSKHENS